MTVLVIYCTIFLYHTNSPVVERFVFLHVIIVFVSVCLGDAPAVEQSVCRLHWSQY